MQIKFAIMQTFSVRIIETIDSLYPLAELNRQNIYV